MLSADEPVYMERFVMLEVAGSEITLQAPLGAECASTEILDRMKGRDPERCVGCNRGVYYGRPRVNRHQAICSRECRNRAARATRAARMTEGSE
jgi:hypothetical protein